MEFSDPSILLSVACKSHIRAQMLAHNTQALEVVYMWPWHHWQYFWGFQTSTITPTLFLKLNRHSEKSYMSKQLLLAFMMVGYKSQINIWVTEGKSKIKLPVGELGHKSKMSINVILRKINVLMIMDIHCSNLPSHMNHSGIALAPSISTRYIVPPIHSVEKWWTLNKCDCNANVGGRLIP